MSVSFGIAINSRRFKRFYFIHWFIMVTLALATIAHFGRQNYVVRNIGTKSASETVYKDQVVNSQLEDYHESSLERKGRTSAETTFQNEN